MSELTYKKVIQGLIRNPKDSVSQLEAILVNKSTRIDDIKTNIQKHEMLVDNHKLGLSGDESIEGLPNPEPISTRGGLDGITGLLIPILVGGAALFVAHRLISNK
jgi:hypothetical protein